MNHPRIHWRQNNIKRRRRSAHLLELERLESRQLLATTAENVFTVTNALDTSNPGSLVSRQGSLRDAINWANSHTNISPSTPDSIQFAIPNLDMNNNNVQVTIPVLSPLPTITDPVAIDGYSESGSSINQTPTGGDEKETDVAVLMVRLDGLGAVPGPNGTVNGLTVAAPNCTIDGLAITGFSGAGIELDPGPNSNTGAVGDWVWGNFIGVDSFDSHHYDPGISGLDATLSNGVGIRVKSSNNRIGATLPPGRNVIQGNGIIQVNGVNTGNGGAGVELSGATGNGNLVEGNFILDNGGDGVAITTSHNFIGEAIGAGPAGGGNIISGNQGNGIHIEVDPTQGNVPAQGNVIVNNEIGTNVGIAGVLTPTRGMRPLPNIVDGIRVEDSPGNIIGGLDANSKNVIASNGFDGITIRNNTTKVAAGDPIKGATTNRVLGNWIGYNLRGGLVAILPNRDGINLSAGGNVIGGTTDAARNVIVNNTRNGITISDTDLKTDNTPVTPGLTIDYAQPMGNVILGNYIGTEGGGDHFGNTLEGIFIYHGTGNTIGGTANGSANVIAANNDGVVLGNNSSGNAIQGNLIGTTSDGLTVLGNALDGVHVADSPDNTIGGTAAGAGNTISGNKYGIRLLGPTTLGNLVQGNLIGTDAKGVGPVRNAVDGILIDQGASANTIGGTAVGAGNTIAYNVGNGITIGSGNGNPILSNQIDSNNLLGIDLGGDGVTPNHPGGGIPGPNDLQNYPVLTSVSPSGVGTNVQGTFNSTAGVPFLLQFFANDPTDNPASVEGQRLIGSTTVTTDGSGNATFNVDLGVNVPSGQFVTATATRTNAAGGPGDTSEFSNALPSAPVMVQFNQATYSVHEEDGTATITLARSGGMGGKVAVTYSTGGGTATAGVDYTPVTSTVTFNPGETTQTFSISILDDHQVENNETLNLALSNPSGGATLGPQATAILSIVDNDQQSFQFSAPAFAVNENAGTASITVTRNTGNGAASVSWSITGGSAIAGTNYTAPSSTTVTFNPGETSKKFTIPILDDHQVKGNVTLNLALNSPAGGILGATSTAVLTIVNTDQADPGAPSNGSGPANGPATSNDHTSPTVQGLSLVTRGVSIRGVVLTFSEPLNPDQARNLGNYDYFILTAGRDKIFGTFDDGYVPIASVSYDPNTLRVTLTPRSPLSVNQSYQLKINRYVNPAQGVGLTDLAGNLLDGSGAGIPGSPYTSFFGRAPRPPVRRTPAVIAHSPKPRFVPPRRHRP